MSKITEYTTIKCIDNQEDNYNIILKDNKKDLNVIQDIINIDTSNIEIKNHNCTFGLFGFHKNFVTVIMDNSIEKNNFKKACLEWRLVEYYYRENHNCVCSKNINHCYIITNIKNFKVLDPVGCDCIKHIGTSDILNDLDYYQNYSNLIHKDFNIVKRKYCFKCLKFIDKRKNNICNIKDNIVYKCKNCSNINYKFNEDLFNIINSIRYEHINEPKCKKHKPRKHWKIMNERIKDRLEYRASTLKLIVDSYKKNKKAKENYKIDFLEYKNLKFKECDTSAYDNYEIKFGKYKGTTFKNMIKNNLLYCEWMFKTIEYESNKKMYNYFDCRINLLTKNKYKKFHNLDKLDNISKNCV